MNFSFFLIICKGLHLSYYTVKRNFFTEYSCNKRRNLYIEKKINGKILKRNDMKFQYISL